MDLRQQWNVLLKFGCNVEETNETTQPILCCDSFPALGMIKRKRSTHEKDTHRVESFLFATMERVRPEVRLVQVKRFELG